MAATRVGLVFGSMTIGKAGAQTCAATAREMLELFCASKFSGQVPEVDSARMYNNGDTEAVLGKLMQEYPSLTRPKLSYSSKANPFPTHNKTLTPESVVSQLDESLRAFQLDKVDIFYLHAPDTKTPIELTLGAVQQVYEAGKFVEFGLSNYAAWEVAYIHGYMRSKQWVLPTVYQGMYNSITRSVEAELLPCLRKLGIRFYAYNPLAGGVLTGKHMQVDDKKEITDGRFSSNTVWGKAYQARFMQTAQFEALGEIAPACEAAGISMTEAALRWMIHHSQLHGSLGDRVILGASKMSHFEANMAAVSQGPLPDNVVEAYERAWVRAKPVCPDYQRGSSGTAASL